MIIDGLPFALLWLFSFGAIQIKNNIYFKAIHFFPFCFTFNLQFSDREREGERGEGEKEKERLNESRSRNNTFIILIITWRYFNSFSSFSGYIIFSFGK